MAAEEDTMWVKMSRRPKESVVKDMLASELAETSVGDEGAEEHDDDLRPVLPLNGSMNIPVAQSESSKDE